MLKRFLTAVFCVAIGFGAVASADDTKKSVKDLKGKSGNMLEQIFKKLDVDKDSKVSKEEYAKLSDSFPKAKNITKEKLEESFKKLDTNNDNYLSADEFKDVLKNIELGKKKKKDDKKEEDKKDDK